MRSAGLSDVESILSFWRESAEGTNRQDDRPSVERLLNRDPDALLLAVVGKDIVGTVIAGWDGWRCHLYRIAVRGDWRRRAWPEPSSRQPRLASRPRELFVSTPWSWRTTRSAARPGNALATSPSMNGAAGSSALTPCPVEVPGHRSSTGTAKARFLCPVRTSRYRRGRFLLRPDAVRCRRPCF